MQMGGATSPVSDDKDRRLFKFEMSYFPSEIEIFKKLKRRGDDNDQQCQKQFWIKPDFRIAHVQHPEKIGQCAANQCGDWWNIKIFIAFTQFEKACD
jgi:hypothetical protein